MCWAFWAYRNQTLSAGAQSRRDCLQTQWEKWSIHTCPADWAPLFQGLLPLFKWKISQFSNQCKLQDAGAVFCTSNLRKAKGIFECWFLIVKFFPTSFHLPIPQVELPTSFHTNALEHLPCFSTKYTGSHVHTWGWPRCLSFCHVRFLTSLPISCVILGTTFDQTPHLKIMTEMSNSLT